MKISSINTNNKFYNTSFRCKSSKIISGLESRKPPELLSLGKLVDMPEIFNSKTGLIEKVLLFYKNSPQNGCFRIIKNSSEKIELLENFIKSQPEIYDEYKNLSFSFSNDLLKKIEEKDAKVSDSIKDLFIAEIVYTTLNKPEEIRRLNELNYQKVDKNKDAVCIQNFVVNQKEYQNAYRFVSIPLLKSLVKNNDRNIIIKANAFGEKKESPINLYLRQGFKPLNGSMEEIERHKIQTSKGLRIDPNYSLLMWLPENAILYDILKNIPSNLRTQDWFYRVDNAI